LFENKEITELLNKLKTIQRDFKEKEGVNNIYSNSRYFEILIANEFGHRIIAGFSGHRDAKDDNGNEYEYKHYKESSSNHSWTFNDFSDSTISKLKSTKAVIFAHIEDKDKPRFDWFYYAPGKVISEYLKESTKKIKNTRKMINVSPSQLEHLGIQKIEVTTSKGGHYKDYIEKIQTTVKKLEETCHVKNILTSNKLWELLVALKLGHILISEQKQYDAMDRDNKYCEYKVSQGRSWNFEDITEGVLDRLRKERIFLAVVDKENLELIAIYEVSPQKTVELLQKKLAQREKKYKSMGKIIRRKQESITASDLNKILIQKF
jgi:hypothetical protein